MKTKQPRQPRDPSKVVSVTTKGKKVWFRADLFGAPLRRSAWSAWCDYEKATGAR